MDVYLFSHQVHLYKSFYIIVLLNTMKYVEFMLVWVLKLEASGMKYNSNSKEKWDPYLEFQQRLEEGGAFQKYNVTHFYGCNIKNHISKSEYY